MDNVTHTLFALTLAATPLGRRRGATTTLVIAANAPDVDVVTALGGTAGYLRWHRGPTHGLLGVVGLAIACAALVAGLDRLRMARGTRGSPGDAASFRSLIGIALAGALSHVLMDLPTSYGTRVLSPIDWHWFAVDWLPIVDIYLLMALAAGLLFGRLTPQTRRHNAAIALTLMAANYAVRGVAHHRALAIAPRVFGPTLPQPCPGNAPTRAIDRWPLPPSTVPPTGRRCLVELSAVPTFLSPFRWRVIAHLSNAYELRDVDVLDSRFRRDPTPEDAPWRTVMRVPNVWTAPVQDAARTRVAQTFLGFSRFPQVRSVVDPLTGRATVRWTDMRFAGGLIALDQPPVRPAPFGVTVIVLADGRILAAGFEQ